MNSQLTLYITLITTSAVLNMYLCTYVFIKRKHYPQIANLFVVYTAAVSIYCISAAFGLTALTLEQIKFWTIMQYVGMPFSAPLGLLFVMRYIGFKINKKLWIPIMSIPLVSFIMVATNDFHHWHYRVFELHPELGAPYVHIEIGIWYVVHGILTFSSMFIASLLIFSRWTDTEKAYRPQLAALILGQLLPMVTAFIYLIGLTPPGIDPVPLVLWLSSLLYVWSMNSSRLLSIMPIAKNAIFQSINNGVMVLDESYRLIEYNQPCSNMFPRLNSSMYGKHLDQVWLELFGESAPSILECSKSAQEIEWTKGDKKSIYQVRTTELQQAHHRTGHLFIFSDITEFKQMQAMLEFQANYDELTEVYNRRAFFQQSEQAFLSAKQQAARFTIILLDIDYFKKVNDTYGHLIGDQLLKHVAMICRSQLEDKMIFARYGGEEFVIALCGKSMLEGEAFANKLQKIVESQPLSTEYGVIQVTISCGVAEAVHDDQEETLNQLLNKADRALYQAKREGRNQVCVYTS